MQEGVHHRQEAEKVTDSDQRYITLKRRNT